MNKFIRLFIFLESGFLVDPEKVFDEIPTRPTPRLIIQSSLNRFFSGFREKSEMAITSLDPGVDEVAY